MKPDLNTVEVMERLVRSRPGLRAPGAVDGAEWAIRVILSQHISLRAARTVTGRLVAVYGKPLDSPDGGLTHAFPPGSTWVVYTDQVPHAALSGIHLVDYKVRILDGRAATSAVTRVMLTSADQIGEWTTVGVSDDIVTASWEALADGLAFGLLRAGAEPPSSDTPQDIPLHLESLPEKV